MLEDIKKDAQNRMNKSVESLRHDLTKVRTGRASPALVEHLKVSYYGSDVPLSQVANVAIADARKRKGEWAKFQILYDLHPIARNLMTRLEANVDKGVALVARTRNIPKGERFYVFHGQVANNLGQPVLSEFFAIGLDDEGGLQVRPMRLADFLKNYRLTEPLFTEEITEAHLTSLKSTLPEAIDFAQTFFMQQEQVKLQIVMEDKQRTYEQHVHNWAIRAKAQLDLDFQDKAEIIFLQQRRDKAIRKIETILNERSQFVKDLTSLNNDAYLKLLAVFFEA